MPARRSTSRDLQGDILRAYGNDYDCTSYVFVHARRARPSRRAPGSPGCSTTSRPPSRGSDGKPLTTLNVAVTAAGLHGARRLRRGPRHVLAGVPRRAWPRAPTRARRRRRRARPTSWEPGLGTGEAHVLLTINAQEAEDHRRALGKMRDGDGRRRRPARSSTSRTPQLLQGAREHFGYADGFAQPAIEGSSDDEGARRRRAREGRPLARARARRVRARLPRRGHARRPQAPAAERARRPARQERHVHGLAQARTRTSRCGGACCATPPSSTTAATRTSSPRRSSGAGRTATPLVTHPDKPDPSFDPAARGANDFRYDDDLDGRRCPLGAHIRRSNPRDALGFETRADVPPPHDPPRDALRAAAAARARRPTTAPTAASSSCASRRASRASSRPSRCSGSTTATSSASATTRTSCSATPDGERQDDDPGRPAVLPRPAGAVRHDARRRVPVRARA